MYPQQKINDAQLQAASDQEAASQELYLPSGGTDPDFYFPADRGCAPGRFSRWVHGLPVLGRMLG